MMTGVSIMSNDKVTHLGDRAWSDNLVEVLRAFRVIDPDISANQILTLLYIAQRPGISQAELSDQHHLDLPSGTMARICAVLSDRGNRGTEGKGLIEISKSPKDYRVTVQNLSPKGRRMMDTIKAVVTRSNAARK
jgi:DNA-binding MarR family transcriptional regulator